MVRYRGGWLGLVTVKNCGNDFLVCCWLMPHNLLMTGAISGTDTQACGNLNGMMMKNVTDCNGVPMDNSYTSRELNLSSQHAPAHFEI